MLGNYHQQLNSGAPEAEQRHDSFVYFALELQSKIDSINVEKTMIINNYLLHQTNRNMGRLVEIHIDWYFSD